MEVQGCEVTEAGDLTYKWNRYQKPGGPDPGAGARSSL